MKVEVLFSLLLFCCTVKVFAYTKVLVALGSNGTDLSDDVEIVDLLSSETSCQKPSDFPFPNFDAIGGLGFQDRPIICGGKNYRSNCHQYEDGAWKSSNSFNEARDGFSMSKSPFQDGSTKLFVVGGKDESGSATSSAEVLTGNGWQVSVPPLPVTIYWHCMVTASATSVVVIGGVQNGTETSQKTFLFDSQTSIWSEGPKLNEARNGQSCGLIRSNNETEEKSLIVVGGYDGLPLSSVEVLDLSSDAWRAGPELPFGIETAALVEDPSGGVVLIGGLGNGVVLNTLYKLHDAGPDSVWEEIPQKLKTPRHGHTAFLVPDEIASCN